MKRILILFVALISTLIAFSQAPIVPRSITGTNTLLDSALFIGKNFRPPVYADTNAANAAIKILDSTGRIIVTRTPQAAWVRFDGGWVQIGTGGGGGGTTVAQAFANVSALRASSFYTTVGSIIAFLQGYNTAGDGSSNSYYWDATSSATDDGVFVIKPNAVSGSGRWLKIFNGVVRAKDAGIKTDGTDQTSALNTLASNSSVKKILFDNGSVTISSTFNAQGKTLQIDNDALLKGSGTVNNFLIECNPRKQAFDTTLTETNLLNDAFQSAWWGFVVDGATSNNTQMTKMLNAIPDKAPYFRLVDIIMTAASSMQFNYYFQRKIDIANKPIRMKGNTSQVNFVFPARDTGIYIHGSNGGYRPEFWNIALIAAAQDANDGHVGGSSSNPLSNDLADYHYHGWVVQSVAEFHNCSAFAFSGHGVYIYGNVNHWIWGALTGGSGYTNGTYLTKPLTGGHGVSATGNIYISGGHVDSVIIVGVGSGYLDGDVLSVNSSDVGGTGSGFSIVLAEAPSNASFVRWTGGVFSGNRGAGVADWGPDASQNIFDKNDFRDNGFVGFYDSCFLGLRITHSLFHNNGIGHPVGGCHFMIGLNPNARSSVMEYYGEGSSNPSYIGGNSIAFPGINESGFTGPGTWWVDGFYNKLVTGIQGGTNVGLGIITDPANDAVYLNFANHSGGTFMKWRSMNPNTLYYRSSFNNNDEGAWQMGAEAAEFKFSGANKRHLLNPSFGYLSLFIGGNFYQSSLDVSNTNLIGMPYFRGDVIYHTQANPYDVQAWKVASAGLAGAGAPTTYTEGFTATADGSPFLILSSGPSTQLYPGYSIIVNGIRGTILDTGTNVSSQHYLFMDVSYPLHAASSITMATATFRAYGYSSGNYAQLPTSQLSTNDFGYRFYAIDSLAWYTWTGTEWDKDGANTPVSEYTLYYGQKTDCGFSHLDVVDTLTHRRWYFDQTDAIRREIAISDSESVFSSEILAYSAAMATQSYILSISEKRALQTLVDYMKANSLWYPTDGAFYPVLGSTAAQHAINLMNPGTHDLSFTGGYTHASNQFTPNGTTGFANTGINPSLFSDQNKITVATYTDNSGSGTVDIGVIDGTKQVTLVVNLAGTTYGRLGSDAIQVTEAVSTNTGWLGVTRTSTTDLRYCRNTNGNAVQSTTSNGSNLPNRVIYLNAWNDNGTADNFCARNVKMEMIIPNGMNSTAWANFYTVISNFKTAVGK